MTTLALLGSSLGVGIMTITIAAYGQQDQQQQDLPNRATEGGLSASIAKSDYKAGDTVVINGTVAKYTYSSFAVVEVVDPKGRMVEDGRPNLSPVGEFRFSFTAGKLRQFDPNHWMLLSGEYKVIVRYTPPSIGTLPEREQVQLYFNYDNGEDRATTPTPNAIQEQLTSPAPPPSPAEQQEQNITTTSPAADLDTTPTTNATAGGVNVTPTTTDNRSNVTTGALVGTNTTAPETTTIVTNFTNLAGTAAGGGPIITNLTWYEDANFNPLNPSASGAPNYVDRVEPLSAANIQYQQTDPAFAKLAQTTYDCLTHYNEITKKI